MTKSNGQVFVAIPLFAALLTVAIALLLPTAMSAQMADQPSDVTKADSAKSPDSAGQQPSYPEQKPSYPGAPPSKGKLEGTMGPLKFRFYGTLLLNISASDSAEVGQDVTLWPAPGAVTFPDGTTRRTGTIHDTIFSARQSVFGFTFNPASPPASGWTPSGVLEFDFFGSRPVDTLQPQGRVFNQPRLRLAYFQLEKGNWKIVAGQDKVIIAPLDPISLSHVSVPLGATAGNLWGWLPQAHALDQREDVGPVPVRRLAAAVCRPQVERPARSGQCGGRRFFRPGRTLVQSVLPGARRRLPPHGWLYHDDWCRRPLRARAGRRKSHARFLGVCV